MVSISVYNNEIVCDLRGSDGFEEVVGLLKQYRCKYHPTTKLWKIPAHKYALFLSDLQDIEVISISDADEKLIPSLLVGEAELQLSQERLVFRPELMKYPPVAGKPPNEDFQLRDILRAINRNRYGMFLDMGLGKSYEAAAIIAHLRYYNKAEKVLLISSNIGAANVAHELKKFIHLDPEEIFVMTRVGKNRDLFFPDKKIIITNYNTFRLVCDHYYSKTHKNKAPEKMRAACMPIREWLGNKPGILMLDESHALGNPNSQQTTRVMAHVGFFEYRYLFTGTPADKNEKLYTQLRILDSSLTHHLGYSEWIQEYNETGNYYSSYAINPEGWRYDRLQTLNARVTKNYAVYRDAESHLELPENYIKKIFVDLTPTHRHIYEAFISKTLDDMKAATGSLRARDVVNAFPYMQMALDYPTKILADHPDVLTDDLKKAILHFSYEKEHAKFLALEDILAEKVGEDKERGIIWVWHPATANKLAHLLKKYNPLVITGETSKEEQERMEIIEKFKSDPSHKVLIAGIPVLNTSVTIIEASFQVYLERVYNYPQYIQSQRRIYRIGQTKRVTTYILINDYSIDCALDANLENKDVLNSHILSKEFLSLDEWKQVFNMTEDSEFYRGQW